MTRTFISCCLPSLLLISTVRAGIVDRLDFGNAESVTGHAVTGERQETVTGGLGQLALRLLPAAEASWKGGEVAFRMKVDAERANYFTVRLWGGDADEQRLILLVEGKQIGYRHLGDVEVLDTGCDEPASPGRFYYRTCPLPESLTRGKQTVQCTIQLNGRISDYAQGFEDYQKQVSGPGRGIYTVATHTESFYTPPPEEVQGREPAPLPPDFSGEDVLAEVKKRVSGSVTGILRDKRPPGQIAAQLVARAWSVDWTPAWKNEQAVEAVVRSVDDLWRRHTADAKLVEGDPGVHNDDWYAYGLAGDAVRLLAGPLAPRLQEELDAGNGTHLPRGKAWGAMFAAGRDWLRTHRRSYTNQSMIVDLNIYRQHRAVLVCDPALALPEAAMLRYLHESCGLEPWLGSERPDGPEKPLGDAYFQLTQKGLTRELGYVGGYGEVTDWVVQMCEATRPPGGQPDPRLRAQLEKMVKARAVFRYPSLDEHGRRAMRLETAVGWRDTHFPGPVTYAGKHAWDGTSLCVAGVTEDAQTLRYARQQLEEGQLFASLRYHMGTGSLRVTASLLDVPHLYSRVKDTGAAARPLPMTPGQPDFAFADEENGVLAVKHGGEILYVSLYWRARHAVNSLAKVHHLEPQLSRVAVVRTEAEFEDSGMQWKRPDWTNWGFANGGPRYPDKVLSALAGELLPIARGPYGSDFKPGKESIHAGRATFYRLQYGPWLIGMNTAPQGTHHLKLPAGVPAQLRDLISGKMLPTAAPVPVPPRSTVLFRLVP